MNLISFSNGKTVLPLCINLERCTERKELVQKMADSIGFPVNFVKAIDKNLLLNASTRQALETQEVVFRGGDKVQALSQEVSICTSDPDYSDRLYNYSPARKHCKVYTPYVHSLYLGAVGCALSHLECFRHLCSTGADYALILEDDVSFLNVDYEMQFSRIFGYEFDICLVGTSPQKQYQPSGRMNDGFVYETAWNQWYSGSSAYLVSNHFARKLHPFNFISCASDEFFGYAQLEMGARILCLNDPIFSLSDLCLTTTNPIS